MCVYIYIYIHIYIYQFYFMGVIIVPGVLLSGGIGQLPLFMYSWYLNMMRCSALICNMRCIVF